MRTVLRMCFALVTLVWVRGAAWACPYCQSKIREQVNTGIFEENFWHNFLLTLLPMPVLLGIVAVIHFGLPWPRKQEANP